MSDFLWVEQYRPQTIDECILPTDIKETFQSFVDRGEISNLLLAGPPGCGKTTVARALCEQMNADYMFINGSEESGIDTLRTKIKNFASTVSLSGGKKVVILDEADYLNPQSTQPAMRGFIEEFHKNCRFILTCNFKNRLIEPLHSRFSTIDFKIANKEEIGFLSGIPIGIKDNMVTSGITTTCGSKILKNFVKEAISKIEMKKYFKSNKSLPPFTK